MGKKIKVVWLCHFSNGFVHEKLELKYSRLRGFAKYMAHKPRSTEVPEFANWITNGINEFEKIKDVELHIVSPYPYLKRKIQEFSNNGVCYHFFQNEEDSSLVLIYKKLFRSSHYHYKKNCNTISRIINRIHPDIVHLFGAENPYYALGIHFLPNNVISIAQLQTLMNDPDFKKNYPIDDKSYKYRAGVELDILNKVDYLGTVAIKYRQIIKNKIKPDAVILNTTLALNEPIIKDDSEKQFDFVYFAANINKAADLAIEAFGLAYQKNPNITLDIIGGYNTDFMYEINHIIEKYGIMRAVRFEGKLPTHNDVLNQIRKSRFALLPLKVDLISGTIREAMSNGLPVITTNTGETGTQLLNVKRRSVLLTSIGDHQAMADNMLQLLNDKNLAEELRNNAYHSRLEESSNEVIARHYVEVYMACMENYWKNIPLPNKVTVI